MATPRSITITAARKVSQSYNTRDFGLSITLDLAEGEDAGQVVTQWTQWTPRLQNAVDRAVGDPAGATSFKATRPSDTPK